MAKSAGLGDNYYVGGFDLSGDTNSLGKIGGGPALLDVTDITQSAYSRLGGLRDGGIDWVSYMDPTGSHVALSALPVADTLCTYFRGTAIGNPAAAMVAKQINYDPTRGTDGMLTFAISAQANGDGLEWGVQLTPGLRTDAGAVAASSANSFDTGGSLSFGAQAYLQMISVTGGTSCTVVVNDSADNSSFSGVSGLSFTAVNAGTSNTFQRLATGNTATIRRYLAVATTGTFTSAQFAVVVVKNATAGIVF